MRAFLKTLSIMTVVLAITLFVGPAHATWKWKLLKCAMIAVFVLFVNRKLLFEPLDKSSSRSE